MRKFRILTFLLLSMILYSIIVFFTAGSEDDIIKVGLILRGGRYDTDWDEANASGAEDCNRRMKELKG